jgi:RNA polymerase sigma-70 factor (subfamily 1)
MKAVTESCSAEDFRVLLQGARGGSNLLLGQLLEAMRPFLQHVANQELDSDLEPKVGGSDLVQQTFLEAQQAFDRFDGSAEADLRRWLTRILRNNLEDLRRQYRQTQRRTLERERPGDASLAAICDPLPGPPAQAVQKERVAALRTALAQFSPTLQELIRLRQQEGLTFGEIGNILSMSEEAARKQWTRAIVQLNEKLGDALGNS